MLAIAIITCITEALKAFNAIYADEPTEQRRAGGMLFWNVAKVIVYPLLTEDQRGQLSAIEANAPVPAK